MAVPRPAPDRRERQALAFAPPYERDGTSVITAAPARASAERGAASTRRCRAAGRWAPSCSATAGCAGTPVVDVTKVITAAELVVGGW